VVHVLFAVKCVCKIYVICVPEMGSLQILITEEVYSIYCTLLPNLAEDCERKKIIATLT